MATLRIDPGRVDALALGAVIDWLKSGRIVAFPTDTFYGLAADPASPDAIARVFDIKARQGTEALPLIAASIQQVEQCCGRLGGRESRLAAAFWPGPLSLVLDAPSYLAPAVLGGTGTIAVRVPAHPVARALCGAWGALLPATSANRSGEPPAETADALTLAQDERVLVVDGGRAPGGQPSTIVDARHWPPTLVRAGAIAWNRVLESLNE